MHNLRQPEEDVRDRSSACCSARSLASPKSDNCASATLSISVPSPPSRFTPSVRKHDKTTVRIPEIIHLPISRLATQETHNQMRINTLYRHIRFNKLWPASCFICFSACETISPAEKWNWVRRFSHKEATSSKMHNVSGDLGKGSKK